MPSIRHKPYFQNKKKITQKNRISYHSGADTTHHGIDQIYRIKLQQIDTKKRSKMQPTKITPKSPSSSRNHSSLASPDRQELTGYSTRRAQIKSSPLPSLPPLLSPPRPRTRRRRGLDLWPPPLLGLANSHDARQRETREREKDEFFLRLSPSRSRYRLYIQSAYEIRIRIRLYEMTEVPLPQSLCGMVNLVSSVQRKVEPTKKLFFVFLFPLLC